jgi:hypothetical protein
MKRREASNTIQACAAVTMQKSTGTTHSTLACVLAWVDMCMHRCKLVLAVTVPVCWRHPQRSFMR